MTEYTQAQLKSEALRAASIDAERNGVKVARSAAPTWKIRIHARGRIQLIVFYHDTHGTPGRTTVAI